ncbi:hypothetical protein PNI02_11180 [Pseudoalteromonas nigrifaciens]|nr:hypothetical protein PNI02_11180 [Pseudoalteromonas nigrifaciens]
MPEEVLNNNELMQLVVHILRADLRIADTYKADEKSVNCTVLVFRGLQNPYASESAITGWRRLSLHTTDKYHFFL